jgi:hypothetical protein
LRFQIGTEKELSLPPVWSLPATLPHSGGLAEEILRENPYVPLFAKEGCGEILSRMICSEIPLCQRERRKKGFWTSQNNKNTTILCQNYREFSTSKVLRSRSLYLAISVCPSTSSRSFSAESDAASLFSSLLPVNLSSFKMGRPVLLTAI